MGGAAYSSSTGTSRPASISASTSQVLHDWCLAGHGIAWRSTGEVEAEIDAGLLVPLLDDFAAPPNGIYAVFPQRKHLALRVRLWLDFLKAQYARPEFWGGTIAAPATSTEQKR